MSWMSGPMFPPIKDDSTVPLGSDDIADPAGAEQQEAEQHEEDKS